MTILFLDFETESIQGRPHYPPLPIGVAIKEMGKHAEYWTGSYKTKLKKLIKSDTVVVMHNAKFDLEILHKHFGIYPKLWDDTMIMAFIFNPHFRELGLKELSERLFDEPPEEKNEIADFLVGKEFEGRRVSASKKSENYFMSFLKYAPKILVAKYTKGDVQRTEKLYKFFLKQIKSMQAAYNREKELLPILMDMEQRGIRVNLKAMIRDKGRYESTIEASDIWLRRELNSRWLNLDSNEELYEALLNAGLIDEKKLERTPTGRVSMAKGVLERAITKPVVAEVILYRNYLSTVTSTFLTNWIAQAQETGRIYTTWHQTRTSQQSGSMGTRTGRLSSSPNFQNMPSDGKLFFQSVKPPFKHLQPVNVRSYILPEKDCVFVGRDYCFSDDTEILTRQGFKLFKDLSKKDLVAQWSRGKITFTKPRAYQKIEYEGNLVHIKGERTVDLLVTPNHRCLLLNAETNKYSFVQAEDYKIKHYKQPHTGVYKGIKKENEYLLKLVVAVQADASCRKNSVVFYLKKKRKVDRLEFLLEGLHIPYKKTHPLSKKGHTCFYIQTRCIPLVFWDYLERDKKKTFVRKNLFELEARLRLDFLKELSFWDGSKRKGGAGWSYVSTNIDNVNIMQELGSITGLRATSTYSQPKERKPIKTLYLSEKTATWTDRFVKSKKKYKGYVYCVTMPDATVIVRRNGRVCVTGNSQQETRILAHFVGGELEKHYNDNAWIDFHDITKAKLDSLGLVYPRKIVKNINFGLIYGMGLGLMAKMNGITIDEAGQIKKAILSSFGGLADLYKEMKLRALQQRPITTWGGRKYLCEVDSQGQRLDYKMVNVLVQGSAADCTKQAMINFYNKAKEIKDVYLSLSVHDELVASCPQRILRDVQEILQKSMEDVEFNVPMKSEGYTAENWGSKKNYDKKGVLV